MNVLDSEQYNHILSWTHDGKAFVVLEPEKFQNELLPSCFGLLKFSSFLRKLYRWGFSKSKFHGSKDCPAYSNPDFIRGHGTGCINMMSKNEETRISDLDSKSINGLKPPSSKPLISPYARSCFGEGTPSSPKTSSCQSCSYKNSTAPQTTQSMVINNSSHFLEDYICHRDACEERTFHRGLLGNQHDFRPLTLKSSLDGPSISRYNGTSFEGHGAKYFQQQVQQQRNKYYHQHHQHHQQERHDIYCHRPALPLSIYAHFEQSRKKHDEIISLAMVDLARRSRVFLRQQQQLLLMQKNAKY
jgi:hypothetical protein